MKDTNKQLGYRIIKIQTQKIEFKDISEKEIEDIFTINETAKVDVTARINIDNDDSIIRFTIESDIFNTTNNVLLVSHIAATHFEVNNLNFKYNEDGSHDIPYSLLIQFYTLSYNHARALLADKLSATGYRDKFFLPITDPKKILNIP